MPSDDVEEEEEECEPEKENVKEIRSWLEDVSGDLNIHNDGSMNIRPSGPSCTGLIELEGINASMTDNAAWYEYSKETVLPTPDMNDDSGIAMSDYLQLDPALMRGRGSGPPFNMPAGGFFEHEQPSPNTRKTSYIPHELGTENQPLSDTTGCFQPNHAVSLEGSTKVAEGSDWVMGNNASLPRTTPIPSPLGNPASAPKTRPFPSPVSHSVTPSAPKSTKFRVSITLTCDQAELASALTKLTDIGDGLSIKVEQYDRE